MRRYRSANPNRGPGDFLPPDPEELDTMYLEEARDKLLREYDDSEPSTDEIEALAWALQDKARKQAEDDAAESRYLDKLDGFDD